MTFNPIDTSKTISILNLPGGGVRGYMEVLFLKKFCETFKIKEEDFIKHFDIITGTSIGGLIALALVQGKTPSDLVEVFEKNRKIIFKNKRYDITFATQGKSFYKRTGLESVIKDVLGTNATISNLPQRVIIPTIKTYKNKAGKKIVEPLYISNMNYSDIGFPSSDDFTLYEAACATSAAPVYFEPFCKGSNKYIDGGLWANNPINVAINLLCLEARSQEKMDIHKANDISILDLSTGHNNFDFAEELLSKNSNYTSNQDSNLDIEMDFDYYIPMNLKEKDLKEKYLQGFHPCKGLMTVVNVLGMSMGCVESAAYQNAKLDCEVLRRYGGRVKKRNVQHLKIKFDLSDEKNIALDNTTDEFFKYMKDKVSDTFEPKNPKYKTFAKSLAISAHNLLPEIDNKLVKLIKQLKQHESDLKLFLSDMISKKNSLWTGIRALIIDFIKLDDYINRLARENSKISDLIVKLQRKVEISDEEIYNIQKSYFDSKELFKDISNSYIILNKNIDNARITNEGEFGKKERCLYDKAVHTIAYQTNVSLTLMRLFSNLGNYIEDKKENYGEAKTLLQAHDKIIKTYLVGYEQRLNEFIIPSKFIGKEIPLFEERKSNYLIQKGYVESVDNKLFEHRQVQLKSLEGFFKLFSKEMALKKAILELLQTSVVKVYG